MHKHQCHIQFDKQQTSVAAAGSCKANRPHPNAEVTCHSAARHTSGRIRVWKLTLSCTVSRMAWPSATLTLLFKVTTASSYSPNRCFWMSLRLRTVSCCKACGSSSPATATCSHHGSCEQLIQAENHGDNAQMQLVCRCALAMHHCLCSQEPISSQSGPG